MFLSQILKNRPILLRLLVWLVMTIFVIFIIFTFIKVDSGGKKTSILSLMLSNDKQEITEASSKAKPSGDKAKREEQALSVLPITSIKLNPYITSWANLTLKSAQELKVISEVSGFISEIPQDIDIGSKVNKGELIAKIDDFDFKLSLQQAKETMELEQLKIKTLQDRLRQANEVLTINERQFQLSKANYDRIKSLQDSKYASKSQLEQEEKNLLVNELNFINKKNDIINLKNDLEQQEKQVVIKELLLQKAEDDFAKTSIRANKDLLISDIHITKGQFVQAFTPLFSVFSEDDLVIKTMISEARLKDFYNYDSLFDIYGMPIKFFARQDRDDLYYEGHISSISPSFSAESRSVVLYIKLKDSLPMLNSFGSLRLYLPEVQDIILVPRESVVDNKVYILNAQDEMEVLEVSGVALFEKYYWVKTGLKSGDRLVLIPPSPMVMNKKYKAVENPRIMQEIAQYQDMKLKD